jgi:hypothetical protein
MELSEKLIAMNLEDVTLVDLDTVRFLASWELRGVELVHCSQYIRDWVTRERGDLKGTE